MFSILNKKDAINHLEDGGSVKIRLKTTEHIHTTYDNFNHHYIFWSTYSQKNYTDAKEALQVTVQGMVAKNIDEIEEVVIVTL